MIPASTGCGPAGPSSSDVSEVTGPACTAGLLAGEPEIDGVIGEDTIWAKVPSGSAFAPPAPADAGRKSSFRVGYTAKGLYIAIECLEPQVDRIRASADDMEKLWAEDSVEVSIAPAGTGEVLHLVVSAIGSRYNGKYLGRNEKSLGNWQAVTFIDEKAWMAEIFIPFETLAGVPASRKPWKLNIRRNIRTTANGAVASWSPRARKADDSANFGVLNFSGQLAAKDRRALEMKVANVLARVKAARRKTIVGGLNVFAFSHGRYPEIGIRRGKSTQDVLPIGGPHVAPRLMGGAKEVLYQSKKGGRIGVWLADLKTKAARRICDGDQVNRSFDSRRIVLRRDGRIIERNLTTGSERTVSPAGWKNCALPSFTTDGRVLFVATGRPDKLYITATKGAPVLLASGDIRSAPRCSPDGKLVAYPDGAHIRLLDVASKKSRQLTLAGGVQGYPVWSADGRGICYAQAPDWHVKNVDLHYVALDKPAEVAVVVRGVNPGHDWIGVSPQAAKTVKLTAGKLGYITASAPSMPEKLSALAGPGADWKALPSRPTKLPGGAIVTNGSTVLAISSKTRYVLLAAMDAKGFARGFKIRFKDFAGKSVGPIRSATITTSPSGKALLELVLPCSKGRTAKVSLTLSESRPLVGIEAGPNVSEVTVEAEFSLAIVPDRLGDDIVIDPRRAVGDVGIPRAPFIELPLQASAGALMAITPSPGQTVRLTKRKQTATFSAVRIRPAAKVFYLAPLSRSPGGAIRVALVKSGKKLATKSSVCVAQWRLATILGDHGGSMMVDIDKPGKVLVAPAGGTSEAPQFSLAYLYGRNANTSPAVITPVDILNDALGLEAAEKLLDVEGIRGARVADRQTAYRDYRTVLKVLGWLNASRRKGVDEAIANHCDDIIAMLAALDGRIDEYVAMSKSLFAIGVSSATTKGVAKSSPSLSTGRVKAAAEALKRAAGNAKKGALTRLPQYKEFCKISESAFADRRTTIAAYRKLAKDLRRLAGQAIVAGGKHSIRFEKHRRLTGRTLRNRYVIEADWRGESPLNPSEVSYEKIKNW